MLIEIVKLLVAADAPFASVTVMVKDHDPEMLGVPVMAPLELLKLRPVGTEPALTLKLLDPAPPPVVMDNVNALL